MPCPCAWTHALEVLKYPLVFSQCLFSIHTGKGMFFPFGCGAKLTSLSFPYDGVLPKYVRRQQQCIFVWIIIKNSSWTLLFGCAGARKYPMLLFKSTLYYMLNSSYMGEVDLGSINSSTCFKRLLIFLSPLLWAQKWLEVQHNKNRLFCV